ncbi:hypothetical protein GFK26_14955 [Variovorax paradoxus]|uniref:Uncharacterized protein n=1 Tax=Variovorax paradoxus TaxID=34073 RepID=A0A5Q0M3D5_VARPD|nr:hypothetical protein [Variovorax paradoxus]QFZ83959.1 hypothetical protein GFK26_14955 [Variovorax paradoxus]
MSMFIRVASVCDALEALLPRLSVQAGEAARALLAATSCEARCLCLVPIREGCLTELWAHYIYAADTCEPSSVAGADHDHGEVGAAPAAGWIVFPGPEAKAAQVRRLAQIVDAFHFFAPLGDVAAELVDTDRQLARTLAAIRRIRSTPTDELHGEVLALIPPASFKAPAPGFIRIDDPMPPRPQGYPRYRVNTALLPNSLFMVLHPPGAKVEVDAMFGIIGHL